MCVYYSMYYYKHIESHSCDLPGSDDKLKIPQISPAASIERNIAKRRDPNDSTSVSAARQA